MLPIAQENPCFCHSFVDLEKKITEVKRQNVKFNLRLFFYNIWQHVMLFSFTFTALTARVSILEGDCSNSCSTRELGFTCRGIFIMKSSQTELNRLQQWLVTIGFVGAGCPCEKKKKYDYTLLELYAECYTCIVLFYLIHI